MDKKGRMDLGEQYFFPNGKKGSKIINKIFDNEFIKEIFIDHYPGFRRETLFRIGKMENIDHYQKNIKGESITIGSFKKYFTLELTTRNLKIDILRYVKGWERVGKAGFNKKYRKKEREVLCIGLDLSDIRS